jgi:hypothetical protein
MSPQEKAPLVSVIILNFNGKPYLKPCLTSVLNTNYPNFEIIFVDNNSSDGSVEYVEKEFAGSRIKVIKSEKNLGFTGGNNAGAKYAKGKYVCFLNEDMEVDSNWLKELVKTIESNSNVGTVQSKLRFLEKPKYIQSAGNFFDFYGNVYIRGAMEEDEGQFDKNDLVSFAAGGASIIRRDLFYKIGMFDLAFFFYSEDVDLSWRIWLAGYKVMFAGKSILYHKGKIATQIRPIVRFHQAKNRIATLLKNYDMKNVVKYVPIPVLIYLRETLYYIVKRRLDVAKALVKGILWNLKNLKYIWTKRLWVKYNLRKVSDDYIKTCVMKKPLLPYPFYFLPIRRSRLTKRILQHSNSKSTH